MATRGGRPGDGRPGGAVRPGGIAGIVEATDVIEGIGDCMEPGDDGLGEDNKPWSWVSEPASDSDGAGEFVDFRAGASFRDCFASEKRPGGGVEDREADVCESGVPADFRSSPDRACVERASTA